MPEFAVSARGRGVSIFCIAALVACFSISQALAQDAYATANQAAANDSANIDPPLLAQPGDYVMDAPLSESDAVPDPIPDPIVTRAYSTTEGAEVSSMPRRFRYAFRLTIRGLYDDNINLSQVNRQSDFVTTIEPSVMFAFGDVESRQNNHLQFIYAPNALIYANRDEASAVQHLIHLEAQYRFSRLTLNAGLDVHLLDGSTIDTATSEGIERDRVNLDVGGRTRVNIYNMRLNASYYLSGKTFVSTQVAGSIYDYPSLISSQTISGTLFLNYIYSPRITVGAGAGGGYSFVEDPSPDQTVQQLLLRVSYELSGKTTLSLSGGMEFRQFENNARPTYRTPVMDASLTYRPFDGTNVDLRFSRRVTNSALLAGQNLTSNSLTVGIRQRVFRKFTVGITGGYEHADYFSTVSNADAPRTDNYYTVQPSVDVNVTRFWTFGAYYLRRQNDASVDVFNFNDNQVGLRSSLTF